MELMCSLAIQNEAVMKRLNGIFEEYSLKEGLNELEKCVDEAIKVCVYQFKIPKPSTILDLIPFVAIVAGSKEIYSSHSQCL